MAPYNGNILVDFKAGKKRLSDFFINRHVVDQESDIKPNKIRRVSLDKIENDDKLYEETCKYASYFRCLNNNSNNNNEKEHKSAKSLSCQICSASFILDNNKTEVFKKHAVQHSEIDNLKCLVCKTFKCRKESTIKNHLRDVHNQYPTRSTKNALYSSSLTTLEQLTVNETAVKCFPDLAKILINPQESSNFATCQVCQVTIKASLPTMQEHARQHIVMKHNVVCRICNFEGTWDSVNEHVLSEHNSNSDVYKKYSTEDISTRKHCFNRCFPTMLQ
ncbi:unnamed protein product [Auanema sp. JU1783]|nr:unnamed protein product [Auanema sp. JU1783]